MRTRDAAANDPAETAKRAARPGYAPLESSAVMISRTADVRAVANAPMDARIESSSRRPARHAESQPPSCGSYFATAPRSAARHDSRTVDPAELDSPSADSISATV